MPNAASSLFSSTPSRGAVLLVAGLPASGKSTWAKTHFKRVLEYDSFADALGTYADLEEDRKLVNRQFALLAGSGRYDAVVDVFHTRASRANILRICPGAGIVVVQAPLEVCLTRNAARLGARLTGMELQMLAMQFEPVCADEGFSFIRAVKTW